MPSAISETWKRGSGSFVLSNLITIKRPVQAPPPVLLHPRLSDTLACSPTARVRYLLLGIATSRFRIRDCAKEANSPSQYVVLTASCTTAPPRVFRGSVLSSTFCLQIQTFLSGAEGIRTPDLCRAKSDP